MSVCIHTMVGRMFVAAEAINQAWQYQQNLTKLEINYPFSFGTVV